MEQDSDNNQSDKDKMMKSSFESFSEKKEKADKKEKKTASKSKKIPLFMPTEKGDTKTERAPVSKAVESEKDKESKETKTSEAPLDVLAAEEKADVAKSYVEAVLPDARLELDASAPESQQEAENAASVAFLQNLNEALRVDNDVNDEMLSEAASDALSELGIDERHVDAEDLLVENNQDLEQEQAVDDTEIDDIENPELTTEDEDAPNTPRATPSQLTPPPASPPNNPPAGASSVPTSGGNGTPYTGVYNNVAAPNPFGPQNINIAPTIVTSPDLLQSNTIERRNRAGGLLLAGIVGYMIGRRRGRIRTEKKLIPIQESLEKEVKQLHQTIADKELQVRRIAARQFESRPERSAAQTEKIQQLKEKGRTEQDSQKSDKTKNTHESSVDESNYTKPENMVNPRSTEKDLSKRSEKLDSNEKKISPKAVAQLNFPMLLSVAETVPVEQSNLRILYERGLITQSELREAVKAHLDGEKFEFSIDDHMVGEEIEYEIQQNKLKDHKDDQKENINSKTEDNLELIKLSGDSELSSISHGNAYESMSPDVRSLFENPYDEKKHNSGTKIAVTAAIVFAVTCIIAIVIFT